MSIDVDKLEEWRPGESYSYSAVETYRSTLFRFRTGRAVSILEIGPNLIQHEIKLYGKHEVTTDKECWEIFMKFRPGKVAKIIGIMLDKSFERGFIEGRNSLRTDFYKLLELE